MLKETGRVSDRVWCAEILALRTCPSVVIDFK